MKERKMIATRDLQKELNEIDKVLTLLWDNDEKVEWAKLKAVTLNTKLLTNIRTNMVTIMKHLDIEMKKPAEQGQNDD